jgi:hypothetical protein
MSLAMDERTGDGQQRGFWLRYFLGIDGKKALNGHGFQLSETAWQAKF